MEDKFSSSSLNTSPEGRRIIKKIIEQQLEFSKKAAYSHVPKLKKFDSPQDRNIALAKAQLRIIIEQIRVPEEIMKMMLRTGLAEKNTILEEDEIKEIPITNLHVDEILTARQKKKSN